MTMVFASENSLVSVIRRHAVLAYFVLAYLIAWGGILLVALPVGGLAAAPEALAPLAGPVFIAMALGPSLASIILTALLDGRAGLRALFGGVVRWRIGVRYYAAALFVVPAVALLVLLVFSGFSSVYTPAFLAGGGATLLLTGLVFGLVAGAFEELGWTGFAAARLLSGHTVVATALLIGVLHGVWHLLAGYYWGDGASYGLLFIPYFIMAWIVALVALRLLIVWLYRRTGSTLIAMLAHAGNTGGLLMLWPTGTSPSEQTLWTAVFAVMLLGVVAALVRVRGTGDRPLTPRSSS